MEVSKTVLRRLIVLFWTVVAVSVFAVGLSRPLAIWDEQIYFNAAKNVLHGHWLLPKFTLESHPLGVIDPFLEKPPLVYWIQALAMVVGGETPAVARIPSVLAMSGVIGLTILLAWRLSGPMVGFLAGGVALQIPAFGATRGANDVSTDPFLLLFGLFGIYCLILFVERENNTWAWIAGVGYGAAILSKWVAAAPFGLFALPYLYRYRDRVGWDGFGRVVAGGMIIAVPWFVVTAALAFNELVRQMVTTQVVARAAGTMFVEHEATFGFMRYPYFRHAPRYFGWPLYGLLLAAPVTIGRKWLTGRLSDLEILMWPLGLGVIGLYVFSGGNHVWYILPAAVPIAVLTSDAIFTTLLRGIELIEDYW